MRRREFIAGPRERGNFAGGTEGARARTGIYYRTTNTGTLPSARTSDV
jgi:hypothetical protein